MWIIENFISEKGAQIQVRSQTQIESLTAMI